MRRFRAPRLGLLRPKRPLRLLALALLVVILVVAALWWWSSRSEVSPLQAENLQEVSALEQRLERLEVVARLQALRADIVAEREPEALERRLGRIRRKLEPALQDRDRQVRQELQTTLDELSEAFRRGDGVLPDAFDRLMELMTADPEDVVIER